MTSIIAVRPKSDFALCQAFLQNKHRHPVTHHLLSDEERASLERYFSAKGFSTKATPKAKLRIHPDLPPVDELVRRHPDGILAPGAVELVLAQPDDTAIHGQV